MQHGFCSLLLACAVLFAACDRLSAAPNRARITTVSSLEMDTTKQQLDTATSISRPLSEYIGSIGWWSLANLSHDYFNTSSRNYIERLFKRSRSVLLPQQRKLLVANSNKYKPLIYAIASAAMLAHANCKAQFQNERWDCPDSGFVQSGNRRSLPYYNRLVEFTTRQTAFLTALTSAALMSSVMYTCNKGLNNLPCVCDPRFRSGPIPASQIPRDSRPTNVNAPVSIAAKTYEWGGCSDNVDFGRSFVQQFTRWPQSGNDQRFIANKHNRDAGVRVVESNIETKCQCHGVSGSCQARVCFRRQNQFSKIAENLKRLYDQARRVVANAYSSNPPTLLYQAGNRSPDAMDLVYTDEVRDDDFCNPHQQFGTPGTQRRTCKPDLDSTSTNYKEGCAYLCCGRGYSTRDALRQLPNQIVLAPNNQVRVIPGKFIEYKRYECY